MAIYTGGKTGLRRKAMDLYRSGDNAALKTDIRSIQLAARNVYRKCAKAMEIAGLSSNQSQVRFVTSHLRNYAKVSEIVFGKDLSIDSSSKITLTQKARNLADQQGRAKVREEARDLKKASVKIPFKNKIEGNLFRNWVNDNRGKWAKKEDLSRSGSHTNKYIKKAWEKWGQAYGEAMAHKIFMSDLPASSATPIPAPPKVQQVSLDLPDPFFDEQEDEVGMIQLLEEDPGEFLKQYWYVPAGGFVGIIALSLGVRALLR